LGRSSGSVANYVDYQRPFFEPLFLGPNVYKYKLSFFIINNPDAKTLQFGLGHVSQQANRQKALPILRIITGTMYSGLKHRNMEGRNQLMLAHIMKSAYDCLWMATTVIFSMVLTCVLGG
jgi:hypothetical protein